MQTNKENPTIYNELFSKKKQPMKLLIFLLVIFVLPSPIIIAQDSGFTGYATSVLQDSKHQINVFGFKDEQHTQAYDSLTLQPVGSVSKLIIGLAIMKATEMGLVDLDTDINSYLDIKVVNPRDKTNSTITLRTLATHTSGILDNEKFYIQSYTKGSHPTESLKDYLSSYLLEGEKRYSTKNFGKYQVGSTYNYSNIGAALAAYVVESAAKISFDKFTQLYIFEPLGMKYSHWFYQEKYKDNYADLFNEKDQKLDTYSLITYPDGALKTNMVDLTKLLKTLMDGYQGNSDFLQKESWTAYFAKNFTEKNPVKNINPNEPNTGIFLIYAKSGAIGHTGSDPGVSAIAFFDPVTLRAKIFMGNEDITPSNLTFFKELWKNL